MKKYQNKSFPLYALMLCSAFSFIVSVCLYDFFNLSFSFSILLFSVISVVLISCVLLGSIRNLYIDDEHVRYFSYGNLVYKIEDIKEIRVKKGILGENDETEKMAKNYEIVFYNGEITILPLEGFSHAIGDIIEDLKKGNDYIKIDETIFKKNSLY